jgi:hypothetical protein
VPTISLSESDRDKLLVDFNRILAGWEESDRALMGAAGRPAQDTFMQRFTRLRDALGGATIPGTFNPLIALELLNRVNDSGAKPILLLKVDLSREEFMHIDRLCSRGMIDAHADPRMIRAFGLTSAGDGLRSFLHGWADPAI